MLLNSPDRTEEQARARVNCIQWSALASRMKPENALSQLGALPRFQSYKRSKGCDDGKLKQYLQNGWATEALLAQNCKTFSGDALRNSLVWAFPQAYYSVFAVTLAYFQMSGFTDGGSHAWLIKKFGEEANFVHYPYAVSFIASGGIESKREFKNCKKKILPSQFYFDERNPDSVDTHITRLLNATRQSDLQNRLKDRKYETKSGELKKRFTETEYASAGQKLGHTSILSFLYRKRIKSNYQDIESILSSELKAEDIFPRVIQVVDCLHIIHEAYIARAMGSLAYKAVLNSLPSGVISSPMSRFKYIKPYVA